MVSDLTEAPIAWTERSFYDRHHRGLLRYLAQRLRPSHAAADVAQVVWAAFFYGRGLEHPAPSALLFTIAQRRATSWLRQAGPRAQRETSLTEFDDHGDHLAIGLAGNAEVSLEAVALRDVLRRELKKLTIRQQQAINLIFYYDLDRRAAAEIMNITVDGLKDHLKAAMANLRKSPVLAEYRNVREGART